MQTTGAVGRVSGPATTSGVLPTVISVTGSTTAGITPTKLSVTVSHCGLISVQPPCLCGQDPARLPVFIQQVRPHAVQSLDCLMSLKFINSAQIQKSSQPPT